MLDVIIFLGSPGSGKGTQALKLSKQFGFKHISIGDVLRSNVEDRTDLGLSAKKFMQNGDLVPDDVIIGMVESSFKTYLSPVSNTTKVIFDGFPRTKSQAISLDSKIQAFGLRLISVVFLDVPDSVVHDRLISRGRNDDSPDLVSNRLRVYKDLTEPLLEYYKTKRILTKIDGDRSPDIVFSNLVDVIELKVK
jgi:adenylate kinase